MKRLSTYLLAGIALLSASCSDFLDTAPKDALFSCNNLENRN